MPVFMFYPKYTTNCMPFVQYVETAKKCKKTQKSIAIYDNGVYNKNIDKEVNKKIMKKGANASEWKKEKPKPRKTIRNSFTRSFGYKPTDKFN